MERYRFPRRLMQAVSGLGAAALILSIYRCSLTQLGAPFLLLSLVAFLTSSRYSVPLPRGRGQISLLTSFTLLALLVFGGDAAIVLTAISALCVSLSLGRERLVILFESSISVLSAFAIVWALRLTFGMIAEPGYEISVEFFKAISLAVLIQACVSTTQSLLNEAYLIKESAWRKWSAIFSWTFLTYVVGAIAASISAWVIVATGRPLFTVVVILNALALLTYLGYRKSTENFQAQLDHGTNDRDNFERFRSAFDNAAIGMALVTPEGRWLQVNGSLCKLLGYSEQELMTIDYLNVLHPNDLSPALANFKDLLRGKIRSCQMEKRYPSSQIGPGGLGTLERFAGAEPHILNPKSHLPDSGYYRP